MAEKTEKTKEDVTRALVKAIDEELAVIARPIEKLLGKDRIARFIEMVHLAIARSPELMQADRRSLVLAIVWCAQKKLEPGVEDGAWLIPFKVRGVLTVVPVPGYKGLMKRAEETESVKDIQPFPIYEGDTFEEGNVWEQHPCHKKPKFGTDRGPLVGAYVKIIKPDGTLRFHVMDRKEIEKIRDSGASWRAHPNEGPWKDWEIPMFLKTVIKQGLKYIPVKEELRDLLHDDNQLETGVTTVTLLRQQGMALPPAYEEEPTKPAGPSEEATKFAEQVDKKLKDIKDAETFKVKHTHLEKFLAEMVETYKKKKYTLDQIKGRALQNFASFWTAFEDWETTNYPSQQEGATDGAGGTKDGGATDGATGATEGAGEGPGGEEPPPPGFFVVTLAERIQNVTNKILQTGMPLDELGITALDQITVDNIDKIEEAVKAYQPPGKGRGKK
jgi:phage RecT family recombinase